MPTRPSIVPFAGLLALLVATPVMAQDPSCQVGTVSEIVVDNGTVVDEEDIPDGVLGWGFRLANRLHIRTREDFIRSELLFEPGDCFDPFLLEDSERVLRRYGFISEVEVSAVRLEDGSWRVDVATDDEWSSRVEINAEFDDGIELRQAALSERNLLGRGMLARVFLQQNDAERLVGGTFATPRLFGTRTNLGIQGGSTRVGDFRSVELGYPFVGEVGRYAGRILWTDVEDYFSYSRGGVGPRRQVLLPVREMRATATVAARFGRPGNLGIVGLGVSREDLDFPGFPGSVDVVEDNEFGSTEDAAVATADSLSRQTSFGSGTRLNLILGQRNVLFVQRTGLDALRGVQDVEVGTDVSLTLGRTIGMVGGGEALDDLLVRLRFYGATAPPPWTVITNISIEGRQLFFDPTRDRTGWRDVLAELDLLLYWQPPRLEDHTFVAKLSAAGGWAVDLPYQLTLGGRLGVRGFDEADYAGGRRAILTLEDRIYFPWPFPETFDLGATLFADVGRMWAGDVPFGEDSPWVGTVGAGLRVGFPAGSRGVVRLDLAHPLGPGAGARGWSFRISAVDLVGLTGGLLDPQVDRSRLSRVGADRFTPAR